MGRRSRLTPNSGPAETKFREGRHEPARMPTKFNLDPEWPRPLLFLAFCLKRQAGVG